MRFGWHNIITRVSTYIANAFDFLFDITDKFFKSLDAESIIFYWTVFIVPLLC